MTKFQEVALSLDALSVENDKLKSINAELLEALEEIASNYDLFKSTCNQAALTLAAKARAAIKKARG